MKKVAIVGVEGSGKTVMLAGVGELYARPDAKGYFLTPEDFQTTAYVHRQIAKMRAGQWPGGTEGDAVQALNWTLCRRGAGGEMEEVLKLAFLDFAGEAYRCAFGISKIEDHPDVAESVKALKEHVSSADAVLVLVNLRDVITSGFADARTEEAMWISNSILKLALDPRSGTRRLPQAAIVLSQADCYAETIKAQGGPRATLQRFLPNLAFRYEQLEVLAASAVDRTELDEDGNEVPAKDFRPTGLQPIMDWIVGEPGGGRTGGSAVRAATGGSCSAATAGGGGTPPLPTGSCGQAAGSVKTLTLPGGAKLEMVWCPPGAFTMGEGAEVRRVTLTKGFWVGKYPVTQKQWESVMGGTPSFFKGDDLPVEQVSWGDCRKFCEQAGSGLRLPTEAEWEYACRAGTTDDHADDLDEMAWHVGNSDGQTHPVGLKKPNGWGIHDMLGNVLEWCRDWYGMHPRGRATDPIGSAYGSFRVDRGGGFNDSPEQCAPGSRSWHHPDARSRFLGFRVACPQL